MGRRARVLSEGGLWPGAAVLCVCVRVFGVGFGWWAVGWWLLCRLRVRVARPLDLALPRGWGAEASRRPSVAPPFGCCCPGGRLLCSSFFGALSATHP